MSATPRIRLLGPFDLRLDDAAPVPLDSARAETLLAYLVMHRDAAQPRGQVAFRLWPDSSEAQARTNLRHVLHTLRSRLPGADRYLEITPRTLRWRGEQACWVDVEAFERLLGEERRPASLREAVALYTGDLLEGHDDEWLLDEREHLRQRYLDSLGALADAHEAGGEHDRAIATGERLRRADPLREESYRRLMRLHAARGDRTAAVGVYHDCSTTLERELGVAPTAETTAAYAALLPRAVTGPGPPPAARSSTPLVGRAAERAHLGATWRASAAGVSGGARCVLVSGEAGVGKSRLVEEFRAWCARRGAIVATARCYAAEGPLAYGPVAAWLRSEALAPRLARLDPARRTEIARLLPELLAGSPGLAAPAVLPEDEQRHRLLDAVATVVLAPGPPVLLVVDDLQHGDRETCALLHYLMRREPSARLLVTATARREEIDPDHPIHDLLAGLHALDRCTEIELERLDRAATATLAGRLAGAPLSGPDAARLHRDTEGNPLFVVEAVRAGWPGHSGRTGSPAVTPRVQAVIGARLAQLDGPARELVAVAATIGREVRVDVLAAAGGPDDDTLVRGLDELWRRRILRERGAGVYDFSHDTIREVAAREISPPRRRALHRRVAAALAEVHAAEPGPVSAQIATHHEHGGEPEQAVRWYRRAADAAQRLYAHQAAVDLLERALAQLAAVPASADRDAVELAIRTALLGPLASVAGYVSPATSSHQQHVLRLVGTLDLEPAPPVLRSLGMSALTGEDFPAVWRTGERLQAAGEGAGDDVLVVEGAYLLGMASFWQADFVAARGHLERAVARYRPAELRTHLVHYGQDPQVACLARLGNTHWFLGDPVAARTARDAALARAAEIAHPLSTGIALAFAGLLALDADDEPGVRRHTAALDVLDPEAPPIRLIRAAFRAYVAALDGTPHPGPPGAHDPGALAPAPGIPAILTRVRLAAAVAGGDGPAALAAADALLAMGGAACVWAPEARRVCALFRRGGS